MAEKAARQAQKARFAEYTEKVINPQIVAEEQRADEVAKLVVEFNTDEEGRELANVQTSQAFQDIHDYRGGEKKRWRLDRKKEQVCRGYDARTHLFQKVYYS